jgi:hypothetical protein
VLERDAERIFGKTDVDETRELSRRYRQGPTSVESYLASRTGPLAFMVRLKQIEDETARHERALAAAWRVLAAEHPDEPERFAAIWRERAERWPFRRINALIDDHNHWYPAEAKLPMNPRTGDFVPVDGRSYRRNCLDARWVLDRFPADLNRAH